jgi:hypothetical protein
MENFISSFGLLTVKSQSLLLYFVTYSFVYGRDVPVSWGNSMSIEKN